MNKLFDIESASKIISSGQQILFIAGSRQALSRLPKGPWIGGTISYFTDPAGGTCDQEKVFIHALPEWIAPVPRIERLNLENVKEVYQRIPSNGFALTIIPAFSKLHTSFAVDAPSYPDFATAPLVGWISGVHLDDLGKAAPAVIDGSTGEFMESEGVIAYVTLPDGHYADLGIVNLFRQGKGPAIKFPDGGFSASKAVIDGIEVDFAAWCREQDIDVRLPLVADYGGAMINVSFQTISADHVDFYAPVFPGCAYHQADPIDDYPTEFAKHAPEGEIAFACNCILNYLYAELEGKVTAIHGPATFGEIAYQLLNQTLCYVRFQNLASGH